jgi:hypothetical protein
MPESGLRYRIKNNQGARTATVCKSNLPMIVFKRSFPVNGKFLHFIDSLTYWVSMVEDLQLIHNPIRF